MVGLQLCISTRNSKTHDYNSMRCDLYIELVPMGSFVLNVYKAITVPDLNEKGLSLQCHATPPEIGQRFCVPLNRFSQIHLNFLELHPLFDIIPRLFIMEPRRDLITCGDSTLVYRKSHVYNGGSHHSHGSLSLQLQQ